MPYSIETEDGITIDNIPDTVKPDDPSLKQRVAEIRASQGMTAPTQAAPAQEVPELTAGRAAQMFTRGAAPPMAGAILGGMVGGPPGAVAGAALVPLSDIATGAYNAVVPDKYEIGYPSQLIQGGLTKLGMPEPETRAERALVSAGGAGGGAASEVAALSKLAQTAISPTVRQVSSYLSASPARQVAAAIPAGGVAQVVGEEYGPLAGLLAGVGTGTAATFGARRPGVTPEQVEQEASKLYGQLSQANLQFDKKQFKNAMVNATSNLRSEGYTPTAYPRIKTVIDELTSVKQPKDWTEIQALRKIIAGIQKDPDSETRRLATILKERFDNAVENFPPQYITGNTQIANQMMPNGRNVGDLWSAARSQYSSVRKSEVFSEMLDNAQLDRSKFTQSGAENSLAQQLRNLAKNKSKMRLFSQEEQQAIRNAAKGGTVQNMLKFYGRFAPTGNISGAFNVGLGAYEPSIGIPFTLGAMGARAGATAMRQKTIEDLAQMMLEGKKQPSAIRNSALGLTRGAISAPPLGLLFPYGE